MVDIPRGKLLCERQTSYDQVLLKAALSQIAGWPTMTDFDTSSNFPSQICGEEDTGLPLTFSNRLVGSNFFLISCTKELGFQDLTFHPYCM